MKQTASIISTYSADVFGVCSALFELGGMVIMHDASGCNSTYTTHDEPRWYDMDSMVYISGLSEMEAILGDDEKLIDDIVSAAEDLKPRFIALAGTPIPAMTGFDFQAVAELIRQRTGIPTFGFPTTGMNNYVHGASMALEMLAREFVRDDVPKTPELTVNILGLTPLDFSVNGADAAIAQFLEDSGFQVLSRWAMGSTLEEISLTAGAHVNLVVSSTGLAAAKALQARFGIPYVAGVPMGESFSAQLLEALHLAAATGTNQIPGSDLPGGEILILGEALYSRSLAFALELETKKAVRVICTTDHSPELLRSKDTMALWEEDIAQAMADAQIVIADPLFRPICPENVRFIPLPAESCSGRIYRQQIPNLITGLADFIREVSL